MTIPYFEVSAFTDKPFSGNPAGVCFLPNEWLTDDLLQSIAAENNLAETAFLIDRGDYLDLRWMTPTVEVDLCGHATLASAHVLFNHLGRKGDALRFQSRSGELRVERKGDTLVLDFPSQPPDRCDAPKKLVDGLGAQPVEVWKGCDYYAIFDRAGRCRCNQAEFQSAQRTRNARHGGKRTRKRLRFRIPLLCSRCRNSGGPGDRINALRAHSLLVKAARETQPSCATDFQTRRRIILRRPRRTRRHRRPRGHLR